VTTFTVRGGRNGSQVQITWTDGRLSGDPPSVDLVEIEAELVALNPDDQQSWSAVMYPGHALPADLLADPVMSWRLIESVLDTVQAVDGDVPPEAAAALPRRPHRV
jgi:hypothetical protein